MTADETMNLDAMMDGPTARDGHTGELAAIAPEADEQWIAELVNSDDDGHPAITLPPASPDPPPMSDDERARLYLWQRWAAAYLGTHHLPDWADPWWQHRFGQFLRSFTTVATHARDTAVPFCDDGAPESERWEKWTAANEQAGTWAAADSAAKAAGTGAAVMLGAQPGAPEAEQTIGMRLAPDKWLGTKVRCGGCHRAYTYTAEDPYYGTHRRTGGRCFGCVLGPGAATAAGDGRDVLSIYDQILAERGT